MGRLLVGLLFALAACTDSGAGSATPDSTPSPERLVESSSAECPAMPDADAGTGELALWPDAGAGEIVPVFDSVCATPTAPQLFGLLNEDAAWAGDLEAAASGILHRGHETIATFAAYRLPEDSPALQSSKDQMEASGAATTQVGDLTIAWGRAAGHVVVFWIDGTDGISLSADGEANALEALTAWLRARDGDVEVAAPSDVPELSALPPALVAGPPLAGLPRGYTVLEMNPLSFMAADFADEVTIHGNEDVDALGAAVVLRDAKVVVGTLVAGSEMPELADWAREFANEDIPAGGFAVERTGAFVVGYDQTEVDAFVDAWEAKLKS